MRTSFLLFLSTCAALPSTSYAGDHLKGLSFRHLEALQPRDPLLPSPVETGYIQHTEVTRLAGATAALKDAIPAGTGQVMAEAVLKKAGAHCRATQGNIEICHYFDVQTRDEFVDAVNWYVKLQLSNGHVDNISIDRTWLRS